LKKKIQLAAFFFAILFVNIPFSFARISGTDKADSAKKEDGVLVEVYNSLVLSGTGMSNMLKSPEENKEDRNKGVASLLRYEIPILEYYHEERKNSGAPSGISSGYAPPRFDGALEADIEEQFNSGKPLVLVYHTHTTEAYQNPEGTTRSKDHKYTVVAVGTQLCKALYEKHGIQSLHITSTFDEPYSNAYDRSRVAIEEALNKYPSIQYIYDIHRDAVSNPTEATRETFRTTVAGDSVASVELVLGLKSSFAKENVAFKDIVEERMGEMYPGLFLKYVPKEYYYNQFLKPNSLLIEVGSDQNTPQEAQHSGALMGDVLGSVILEKQKGESD
jgi:stage II sporulation protein P